MVNEKDLIKVISREADMNIDGEMYISVDRVIGIIKYMQKHTSFYSEEFWFKQLEPGMIIHLKTKEEHIALLIQLYRLGYFFDEHRDSFARHFLGEEGDSLDKDYYIGLEKRSDGKYIIFSAYWEDIEFYEKVQGMKLVEISNLIIYPTEQEENYKK